MSLTVHYIYAFCLRLILIIYADFHDKYFIVPYTDIDYKVFSDAARHVVAGRSPFDRHTYRYTPLLAYLLIPNILLHVNFGKILFSLVDILVAILIRKSLTHQNSNNKMKNISVLIWLYNPLTVVISTRGNADSLAVFLVVLTLGLLQKNKILMAGLLHGLSIHFRLYPLVFSLTMYLSLRTKNSIVPSYNQLKLVCGCIASIVILTLSNYYFYGYPFLYESFLYHVTRKDTRHNFSVYFYMLYLSAHRAPSVIEKMLTLLPQLALLLILSYKYSRKSDLPFAMFTQAMVLVTYNPVLTSQYFFWFLSLLPLCLPSLKMNITRFICLVFAWIFSQAAWLLAAYILEFRGFNSFLYIWISSILFFIVNIKILNDLIKCYNKT